MQHQPLINASGSNKTISLDPRSDVVRSSVNFDPVAIDGRASISDRRSQHVEPQSNGEDQEESPLTTVKLFSVTETAMRARVQVGAFALIWFVIQSGFAQQVSLSSAMKPRFDPIHVSGSSLAEVSKEEEKTLLTKLCHHAVTSTFSLENKNLLQAAPQKMEAFLTS